MSPTLLSAPLARYLLYPVAVFLIPSRRYSLYLVKGTRVSKPKSREPVAIYAAEELDLSSPKVSDSCPCSSGFLGA